MAIEYEDSVFEIAAAPIAYPSRKDYIKWLTGICHRVPYPAALPQAADKPFRNLRFQFSTRLRVFYRIKKFRTIKAALANQRLCSWPPANI
jgi:hypothetical protein